MQNDIKYTELGVAKIQEKRNIVISHASKGGFTIAQQVVVQEGAKETKIFLKHGIIVDDIDGLYAIRNAMNAAIKNYEKLQVEKEAGICKEDIPWDK